MTAVPASFTHDDCRALQMALNEKTGSRLYVDGDIGAKTVAQLKVFQGKCGIAQSGCYDDATDRLLGAFMREKYLKHEDYVQAAADLGCEVAVIYAAVEVEAGGDGFLPDGRCDILFERHKFYRALSDKYGTAKAQETQQLHPTICNPQQGGYSGGEKEWDRLNVACAIDNDCGLASASWGMFQIMGSNFKAAGWPDVVSFVAAMKQAERNHLKAFVGFVKADPKLWSALKSRDWATYARIYNGPAYLTNRYDTKLATAYAKFKGVV